MADHGIGIRQALVDNLELNPDPKLALIRDTVIPRRATTLRLKIPGVAKVSVS
jgi:predicted regulator of amino acid metabolism with ACT domain